METSFNDPLCMIIKDKIFPTEPKMMIIRRITSLEISKGEYGSEPVAALDSSSSDVVVLSGFSASFNVLLKNNLEEELKSSIVKNY